MIKIFSIVLGLIAGTFMAAQGQSIRWTSFDRLDDSLRAEPRPLMVFIRTDWCTYCKIQENVAFEDPELAELFNQKFYCLQLDAEATNAIRFLGRTYDFQASRGYHELAEFIGSQNNELVFPTTVLLSHNFQVLKRFQGLQKAEDLLGHHANREQKSDPANLSRLK